MSTATMTAVHPFEQSGNGKAPFRYVGIVHQEIAYGEAVVGSVGGCLMTTKPGGTCDYCGQYILNMFRVESADGNRFKVGCDCIAKVDETAPVRNVSQMRADIKRMKAERDLARIIQARANMEHAHSLKSQPHPTAFMASNGKTLHDYAGWLFTNGGTAGKLRAARMVEASISARVED
jgi:hypothetical protein